MTGAQALLTILRAGLVGLLAGAAVRTGGWEPVLLTLLAVVATWLVVWDVREGAHRE